MKIVVCKNQEEIASLVSDRIIDLVKSKPNCILGLATGSSPVETYKDVIIKGKNVDFSNVKSFNLDEYCNNKDFSQSYRYFMNHNLFDGINIKKENTFFPNENDPSQYDIDIEKADFYKKNLPSDLEECVVLLKKNLIYRESKAWDIAKNIVIFNNDEDRYLFERIREYALATYNFGNLKNIIKEHNIENMLKYRKYFIN